VIERRQNTRYNFGAIAEVADLGSREDVIAVTRDLGLSGCFIKTPTPLPIGTEVRITITRPGSDFAAIGNVTGDVACEGMGIEFVEIEPKHQAVIEKWLGLNCAKTVARPQASSSKSGQVVRLRNRLARHELTRQEQSPRFLSVDPEPEADSPKPLATQFLEAARNFWKFRDEARH
jgi:hypothetical protein